DAVGRFLRLLGYLFDGRFTLAGAQLVDAFTPGELGDPRSQSVRVAQRAEPVVDPCEDILEDILGVVGTEPERLGRDREHVAGEAIDELVPRGFVAREAGGDQR